MQQAEPVSTASGLSSLGGWWWAHRLPYSWLLFFFLSKVLPVRFENWVFWQSVPSLQIIITDKAYTEVFQQLESCLSESKAVTKNDNQAENSVCCRQVNWYGNNVSMWPAAEFKHARGFLWWFCRRQTSVEFHTLHWIVQCFLHLSDFNSLDWAKPWIINSNKALL